MSNDSGLTFFVGDLDGYITIDDGLRDLERERLEFKLDEIGDIKLLAGKSIRARSLGVTPSEWAWAVNKAEHVLGDCQEWASLERPFLAELLAIGRSYSISRYAKWERLAFPSAITATLPLGLKALINQFLIAEAISNTPSAKECIQTALDDARRSVGLTAYKRTGLLQSALHQVADAEPNHAGRGALSREGMRTILSLARLHFSVSESKVVSREELQALLEVYDAEWLAARRGADNPPVINGRSIQGWSVRHIRPLIDLYPWCIRHALSRSLNHDLKVVAEQLHRSILVNELALAHCGVLLMRRAGRDNTRST